MPLPMMSKYGRPLLLVLALVALGASVASLYVHYQLIADPTYVSFCDVSETVSCEAVYKSSYGTVFGVPVAAGGAVWSALVLRWPATACARRGARRGPRRRLRVPAVGRRPGQRLLLRLRLVLRAAEDVSAVRGGLRVGGRHLHRVERHRAVQAGVAGLGHRQRHQRPGVEPDRDRARRRMAARLDRARRALPARGDSRAGGAGRGRPRRSRRSTRRSSRNGTVDRRAAARARGGEPAGRREGAGHEVQRLPVPGVPHDLLGLQGHLREVRGVEPRAPSATRPATSRSTASAASAASTRRPARRRWRCAWPRPRTRRRASSSRTGCSSGRRRMSRDLAKQGLSEIAQVNSFDADYPKTLEAVRADVKLGQQLGRERHADVLRERDPGGQPAAGVSRRRDRLPAQQDLGTGGPQQPSARRRPPASRVYGRDSDRGSHQALLGRVLAPAAVPGPRGADPLGGRRARSSASSAPTAPARPPRSSC